mgnify:CR=1 FL=1|tara:strand:+ start:532 stop:1485 length:954 start_codon:yes stop_codon:yes gene_type:complete
MILVTGAAGFIGYHLCARLLDRGEDVLGIDNLNDYYDVQLKIDRLKLLETRDGFQFVKMDIRDRKGLKDLFDGNHIVRVCHLAAQVGVRYSIQNPEKYEQSNIDGFLGILEAVKNRDIKNFVYASSSSVYGVPEKEGLYSEANRADKPISFYGVTKRANELMAHAYWHLYKVPMTGLRFFTVYGPWMRPDMALFIFTCKILAGQPIDVYGEGRMKRNFTFIDDIIQGVLLALDKPQNFVIYNIGNDRTEELEYYIEVLENLLDRKAKRNYLPQQPGDMKETWADLTAIRRDFGYKPTTNIEKGIAEFVKWYRAYYKV